MGDYIVKAAAADYQIRAYAATTRELTEYARRAHNTSPVATAAVGRLLTAGAMMGSMMKGQEDLLTLKIEGTGPIGGIVVTADSHADVKGYVYHPEVLIHARPDGKLDVAGAIGAGMLQVIQDIGMKEPYVGQIALVSGEIAEDLTYYYAASEQTPSSVALGVLMNRENTVRAASAGDGGGGDRPSGGEVVKDTVRNTDAGGGDDAGGYSPGGGGRVRTGDFGEGSDPLSLRVQ